jgi:hypothetical protein
MIVKYVGGGRDWEYAYVTFGEHGKFANKTFRLKGWLYKKGGKTNGGSLPTSIFPQNTDKQTFYFNTERYSHEDSISQVLIEDENIKYIIGIKDEVTIKELIDYILSESKNGNSNYYMEEICGYWGL